MWSFPNIDTSSSTTITRPAREITHKKQSTLDAFLARCTESKKVKRRLTVDEKQIVAVFAANLQNRLHSDLLVLCERLELTPDQTQKLLL